MMGVCAGSIGGQKVREGAIKDLEIPAETRLVKRFTLYGSPHSLPTYKVALMLRLSGAPFSFRYVSFQKGMHKTPDFLALSRWSQVPVLVDDGRIHLQSAAIVEHLAETLGRFQGPDPAARQLVREWLYWDVDALFPPIFNCYGVQLGQRNLLAISVDPVIADYHHRRSETAFNTGFPPRRPRLSLRCRTYHRGPVLLWRRRLRGNLRIRFESLGERGAVGKEGDGAGWLPGAIRNAGHGGRRVLLGKAAPLQDPAYVAVCAPGAFGAARKMHHAAGPALGSAAFSGRTDGLIRSRTIWKTT